MKSSRWIFALALGIVGIGVAASGVAFLASRGAQAPPQLAFVPSSATVVGQVDVRSLASSPLALTWTRESQGAEEKTPADSIFEAVGIDVFRDLDSVTFSFAEGAGKSSKGRWGLVATGTFDARSVVERVAKGELGHEEHAGTRIYRFHQGEEESAMAVANGSTLLLGEKTYLREMLDAANGRSPDPKALVESVRPEDFAGETFWVAGKTAGALSPMLSDPNLVPPLESFSLSGRLDEDVALRARGRASSSESAQQLVDVVRGFVALGRMSGGSSSPELASLAEAVAIDRLDRDVEIHLSVPYETIEKLAERSRKEAEEPSNRR